LLAMATRGRRSEWPEMCRLAWHLRSSEFVAAIERAMTEARSEGQRAALAAFADITSNGSRRAGKQRRRRRSKRS
jgi:hypothetical protein